MHSLPVFLRLAGRPVILAGEGASADAKRRLLERAGAIVVGAEAPAALAIVAIDEEEATTAMITALKARGILVNAVDRPEACDFTLPAIVDRDPLLLAIGTGGASAGLAKALRQRLETLLPATLGRIATMLAESRPALRAHWPESDARRRGIDALLAPGGPLDPLADPPVAVPLLASAAHGAGRIEALLIISPDPDELTLRAARLLGAADRLYHAPAMPAAILDRARADAARIVGPAPALLPPGLSLVLDWKPR